MLRTFHLVVNFGLGHRSTEVILSDDFGLDLFTQLYWLLRSVNLHFVFGLTIFLDNERSEADQRTLRLFDDASLAIFFNGSRDHHLFCDTDLIGAQSCVNGQRPFSIDARPAISPGFNFIDDIPLGIADLNPALLVGIAVFVCIKSRFASPQAKLHSMAWSINRAVRD